jgi:DNA-directed RNA polymerase subunit RPC12/RpoP
MAPDTAQGDSVQVPTGQQHQYPCTSCGAALEFKPGTSAMVCPYCGVRTAIAVGESQKHDYATYAAMPNAALAELAPFSVPCRTCGATQTTTALSSRCPSCKGALVVTDDLGGELKAPDGIVAFVVTKEVADKEFKAWSASRWFAPNTLKRVVRTDSMVGTYLPHWGFDDHTTTDYDGQRGDHYWATETYTVTENGHPKTHTRQVQRTRWHSASGRVSRDFVDVLTSAVAFPDASTLEKLGPWSTPGATAYESEFLAGFDTPRYTVPADTGFTEAQQQMAPRIEQDCRDDIGGDEQRVSSMQTVDAGVLFRLLLMPLWMATYLVAGKTYHVYVNANTGKVVGERPYSVLKILGAVLGALCVIGAIVAIVLAARG